MARDAALRLAKEPDVGHVSDSVIAQRLGISRKTVLAWRKREGIRAYDDPAAGAPRGPKVEPPASHPARGARPGLPGDEAAIPKAARAATPADGMAGSDATPRAKASRLESFAHLLGRLPDREVALQAGVSPENVRMYRQRRGIVAEWREGEGPPTRVELALAKVEAELGRLPDVVIAARAGVSRSAVTQYRARHGIAAGRKEPDPAVQTAAARPEPVGFEVTVRSPSGDETLTVLAADASSAALSAARFGEVQQLRRIGRVV